MNACASQGKSREGSQKSLHRRGQIWVSYVLFTLLAVSVLVIILRAGTPIADKLKDKVVFSKAEESIIGLDSSVSDVATESLGSQRVVPLDVPAGKVVIADDAITYQLESKAALVSPGSTIDRGSMTIAADALVRASKNGSSLILHNDVLLANITLIGNSSAWQDINASQLISYLQYGNDRLENISIGLGLAGSEAGTGYTELLQSGTALGAATVLARINASTVDYELTFRLKGSGDFLELQARNIVVK
ncbi:hypothetical protein COY28_03425 [Candidatus Woesearchaeota archaeon CG_4_10_14_0_2_um_filter_57_5]|nr:MAG: hypothetical protein COV94_00105 [Candidatus Woesearchaeota archaeon CG11_big_fil_rev_8_21_14_0_20_57_5]PIZ53636.1 MAG: hypothetical protein COY28_03425 [Candidatus Woesearchaeota archaeon CG_4_10_14_0_2_um_filter_57_5]